MSDENNTSDPRSRFQFEKNVPIPPITHADHFSGGSKYPYQYMEIGESFLAAGVTDKKDVGKHIAAVSGARTKNPAKRFVYRCTAEGFRVWRNMDVVPHKGSVK